MRASAADGKPQRKKRRLPAYNHLIALDNMIRNLTGEGLSQFKVDSEAFVLYCCIAFRGLCVRDILQRLRILLRMPVIIWGAFCDLQHDVFAIEARVRIGVLTEHLQYTRICSAACLGNCERIVVVSVQFPCSGCCLTRVLIASLIATIKPRLANCSQLCSLPPACTASPCLAAHRNQPLQPTFATSLSNPPCSALQLYIVSCCFRRTMLLQCRFFRPVCWYLAKTRGQ